MRGQYAHCLRSVAVTVTGAAATAAPASGPVSPIGAFLRLRLVDELALGRDILLAHGEQQDLPHVFAERVGQPGRQLAPPARVPAPPGKGGPGWARPAVPCGGGPLAPP